MHRTRSGDWNNEKHQMNIKWNTLHLKSFGYFKLILVKLIKVLNFSISLPLNRLGSSCSNFLQYNLPYQRNQHLNFRLRNQKSQFVSFWSWVALSTSLEMLELLLIFHMRDWKTHLVQRLSSSFKRSPYPPLFQTLFAWVHTSVLASSNSFYFNKTNMILSTR